MCRWMENYYLQEILALNPQGPEVVIYSNTENLYI